MKIATPRQAGKSLEKAALVFSMLNPSWIMMTMRVVSIAMVVPTPKPKRK